MKTDINPKKWKVGQTVKIMDSNNLPIITKISRITKTKIYAEGRAFNNHGFQVVSPLFPAPCTARIISWKNGK